MQVATKKAARKLLFSWLAEWSGCATITIEKGGYYEAL